MKRTLPRLTLIAAAVITGGCAVAPRPASPVTGTIVPHQAVRDSPGAAAAHYAMGKRRLADGSPQAAIESFDIALKLVPGDPDARNGRASALAQLGRTEEAIDELRRALAAVPSDPRLNNNLGYLLATEGRLDDAAAALRTALIADPANARIRANWEAIAAKAAARAPASARGPGESVAAAPVADRPAPTEVFAGSVVNVPRTRPAQQAAATPVSAVRPAPSSAARTPAASVHAAAPAAVHTAAAAPAKIVPAVPAVNPGPAPLAASPAASEVLAPHAAVPSPMPAAVVAPAPAALVARTADTQPPPRIEPARAAGAPPDEVRPKLVPGKATTKAIEVSNGAGVNGLARRMAGVLRAGGVSVGRVTNWRDFRQETTTLRYRDGHLSDARALQERLGLPESALVRDDSMPPGTDARLVLGRDAIAGVTLGKPLRASYLEALREEAIALQALLDSTRL
jgi:hypothetical protein